MAFLSIRSTIMCKNVTADKEGTHIHSLLADPLYANSNPGFVTACLAVQVECDGQPTKGRIELRAEGFAHSHQFEAQRGERLAAGAIMIFIPVLREGDLEIAIVDAARPEHRLTTRWGLAFEEDAQVLGESAADTILAAAKKHADQTSERIRATYRRAA